MNNLSTVQDAFEHALRDAEKRHKAHVEATGDTGDWVPFYAAHLAVEFAGVRIPLPVIATVNGKMSVPDATGDSTGLEEWEHAGDATPDAVAAFTLDASNRKWEPVENEEPCYGYGCGE